MAIPAQIKDPAKTAKQLARILQAPEEKIYEKITQRQLIVKLHPWGRKISEEKARQIQGLRLPGIAIAEDSKRYYPHGSFAPIFWDLPGSTIRGWPGWN